MGKLTLYKVAIGSLLVLNLVLVAFLWFGRPSPQRRPFLAIERFSLEKNQADEFLKSVDAHRLEMQRIDGEQRTALMKYFSTLKSPSVEAPTPVPPAILLLEEEKIQTTYDHLLMVKNILNAEQLAEYPEFIDYIIRQVVQKGQKDTPPRRKSE